MRRTAYAVGMFVCLSIVGHPREPCQNWATCHQTILFSGRLAIGDS